MLVAFEGPFIYDRMGDRSKYCKFQRFFIDPLKATTGGKKLYLGPQVVALIIFLPGHFCSSNLFIKWKVM